MFTFNLDYTKTITLAPPIKTELEKVDYINTTIHKQKCTPLILVFAKDSPKHGVRPHLVVKIKLNDYKHHEKTNHQ